jgi:hypothetical protein
MSTPRMFWFFLWRMTLWGLGLGSGLGTTYGLLVGGLTFPYGIGLMLVGPLFGAVGRLVLGAVTVLWHRGGAAGDPLRYRRAAELACAAVCIVALALFFELTARMSGTSFVAGPAYDSEDVVSVLIVVVAPSFLATGASWWAGRRVAGKYTSGFGEPANNSPAQARGESPIWKERSQLARLVVEWYARISAT